MASGLLPMKTQSPKIRQNPIEKRIGFRNKLYVVYPQRPVINRCQIIASRFWGFHLSVHIDYTPLFYNFCQRKIYLCST